MDSLSENRDYTAPLAVAGRVELNKKMACGYWSVSGLGEVLVPLSHGTAQRQVDVQSVPFDMEPYWESFQSENLDIRRVGHSLVVLECQYHTADTHALSLVDHKSWES